MKKVLLSGHRKSGTSLLSHLLDGHPQLNVFPEDITFLYALFPEPERWGTEEMKTERLKKILARISMPMEGRIIPGSSITFSFHSFWSVLAQRISCEMLSDYILLLECFMISWVEYARLDPTLPFVFKETTQTLKFTSQLIDAIDLCIVHLVRDPRDNLAAISAGHIGYYSRMGETRLELLASVVNRIRVDLSIARFHREAMTEDFFALRFEDLALRPYEQLKCLCKYLRVDFSEMLLRPTILGVAEGGNSHDGHKNESISSRNVNRWKERLSVEEYSVVNFFLRDVIEYWGYNDYELDPKELEYVSQFYDWYNTRYFFKDSFGQ